MRLEVADARDVDSLADEWVALAAEQRAHGSHLHAAQNRARIRESMAHHVVQGTCLVARLERDDVDSVGDVNSDADASAPDASDVRSDLLGFVTFTVESDGYELDVRRGCVENLYVVPTARGEGVGAALLSAVESELASRGVEVVTLEVLARNERARDFYEREGYGEQRVVVEKRVDVETDTKGNRRE